MRAEVLSVAATTELFMDPSMATDREELDGLRLELLRQATEVYLDLAYPSGRVPEAVQRRLAWRDAPSAVVHLTNPPFEKAGKTSGRGGTIYALRLGNHRYPHMKLQ